MLDSNIRARAGARTLLERAKALSPLWKKMIVCAESSRLCGSMVRAFGREMKVVGSRVRGFEFHRG